MNDFERRLSDALRDATTDYRPNDPYEAKQRFMKRYRRRRAVFLGGAVAVAGAAVAAALLVVPQQLTERAQEPLLPATKPRELSSIIVGSQPSGVAFGNDAVWVANSGDGTVSYIDPLTNSVVETFAVGGEPDDVAVGLGAAWVSDSGAGTITKIPLDQPFDPVQAPIEIGGGNHLDVAPGSGAVWVVSEGIGLYRIDPATDTVQPIETVTGPTDVAAGQDTVWVLEAEALTRIDPTTGETLESFPVAAADNQDLQLSEGAVWVANGDAGEVTRVDLDTGEASEPVYLGGNFTAIASGEGSMWMVSGNRGDIGNLTRIDPETNEIIGEPVALAGRPYDVTTGAGSIWVVNYSAGSLSRLDPNALPESLSTPEPEEPGRPLFAFSADGDLYIEDVDGELVRVTDSDGPELFPSLSPDATAVAFQRGIPQGRNTEVVILDLLTGNEQIVGPGELPSFGPDGRLAYVGYGEEGGAFDQRVVIVRPGSDDDIQINPDTDDDPFSPVITRNLSWDLAGEYLYFEAGWEGDALFQADPAGDREPFELDPGDSPPGSAFAAPAVRGRSSVHALRACCSTNPDDRYEGTELGVIQFTEGGPQYETVVALNGLDASGLTEDPTIDTTIAPFGRFTVAGGSSEGRSWRQGSSRSWLLTTPTGIWVLTESGEVYDLGDLYGFDEYAGISVAQQFRQ